MFPPRAFYILLVFMEDIEVTYFIFIHSYLKTSSKICNDIAILSDVFLLFCIKVLLGRTEKHIFSEILYFINQVSVFCNVCSLIWLSRHKKRSRQRQFWVILTTSTKNTFWRKRVELKQMITVQGENISSTMDQYLQQDSLQCV